jgi:hypothetical protein
VKARYELLEAAIGVFPEEDQAYLLVTTLSWIFPLVIIVASVVDMLLVIIYMRFAHPWKGILFHEEVTENEQEEVNAPKVCQEQALPKTTGNQCPPLMLGEPIPQENLGLNLW